MALLSFLFVFINLEERNNVFTPPLFDVRCYFVDAITCKRCRSNTFRANYGGTIDPEYADVFKASYGIQIDRCLSPVKYHWNTS